MSGFIVGGNIGGVNRVCATDKSCAYRDDEAAAQPPVIVEFMGVDTMAFERGSFQSPWWPQSSNIMGWDGTDTHLLMLPAAFSWPWITLGANGRLGFVGITRDRFGSALGGCTVKCFRTSSDELVSTVISDPATGYYIATTPYNDAHYLVVQGTGVAGASVNTVTPA